MLCNCNHLLHLLVLKVSSDEISERKPEDCPSLDEGEAGSASPCRPERHLSIPTDHEQEARGEETKDTTET